MSDPGNPRALWERGTSRFLLPMTYDKFAKECNRDQQTSRAVVKLAVGNAQAIYWNEGEHSGIRT
eukprot:8243611-Prorocentrum_lima.AAC.1